MSRCAVASLRDAAIGRRHSVGPMDRWDRLEFVEGGGQKARLLEGETELLLVPRVGLYDR